MTNMKKERETQKLPGDRFIYRKRFPHNDVLIAPKEGPHR